MLDSTIDDVARGTQIGNVAPTLGRLTARANHRSPIKLKNIMFKTYTTTVYTENGAKAIDRNLSYADAKEICETASHYGSYAEITVGKDVICKSSFAPDYIKPIDRSHL